MNFVLSRWAPAFAGVTLLLLFASPLLAANKNAGTTVAAFLKVGAGAPGKSYQFTLQTKGFNSVDASPIIGSLNFTLPVTAVSDAASVASRAT